MFYKVWNTELEAIAQRWADQCNFGHDTTRDKLDGTSVSWIPATMISLQL